MYIWLTISSCYGSISLTLGLIGNDDGLSTVCHRCGFACQQRVLKTFPGSWLFPLQGWGSLTMTFTVKFAYIYIYIYIYIYVCVCLLFLNQPISSRRKEKTHVLLCATFIMKKQPFICERRWCSFMLVDLGIFIDFLVLEKKKTKMCSIDSCMSSIFKKDQGKQSKKFYCPVHQIKMCKK